MMLKRTSEFWYHRYRTLPGTAPPRSRDTPAKVLLRTCVNSQLRDFFFLSSLGSFELFLPNEILSGHSLRFFEMLISISSVFSVQDEPPPFLREGGQYKYSKAFKEMVESCLAKDPAVRPSAVELLDTPFFKSAKRRVT